jgi:tetrahydromethanopterin S-methyltransferase subunit A
MQIEQIPEPIVKKMSDIKKVELAVDYPPEEGCYLRGNDYSPVAVVVILRWMREQTPPDIEKLVRVGVENGAALAGTLQTENIGIEKIICNVVSNPNIRYLIVCGPETPGHLAGDAVLALVKNGLDERKRIIGTEAPTPFLFNIQPEFVKRFCDQITVIELINEGSPEVIRQAVWSCYQEKPTSFRQYELYDPGAYPDEPLSEKITWKITQPSMEPKNEEENKQSRKIQNLMEHIRRVAEKKRNLSCE